MTRRLLLVVVVLVVMCGVVRGERRYLGALREDPYRRDSLSNVYGAGNPYRLDGLLNSRSRYGSEYSDESWRNPMGRRAPVLYEGGEYRGRLSVNPYERDSVSNPYGRYGSEYSRESINNPYGAGNPYKRVPIRVYSGR
jgi:hypothetical protein